MANIIRYFPTQAFNFAFKDTFKNMFPSYNPKTDFWKVNLRAARRLRPSADGCRLLYASAAIARAVAALARPRFLPSSDF